MSDKITNEIGRIVKTKFVTLSNTDMEVPVNVSLGNENQSDHAFYVLRFTTVSPSTSTSRGVVIVPRTQVGTGAFYPLVIGGVAGWVRIDSNTSNVMVIGKSYDTLYLSRLEAWYV